MDHDYDHWIASSLYDLFYSRDEAIQDADQDSFPAVVVDPVTDKVIHANDAARIEGIHPE